MHPEKALFQAFVLPSKRQRYSELLEMKRGRDKIRFSLDHFKHLDPRFCWKIQPAQQNCAEILRILKGLGAPLVCYVMSSDSDLDGREMGLSDALASVVGRGQGTFISCVPGELAYFEGEEPHERYICHREPPPA
jgi:hypothetical protein